MPLVRVSNGGSVPTEWTNLKSSASTSIQLSLDEIKDYKYVVIIGACFSYSVSWGTGIRITNVSRSPLIAGDTYGTGLASFPIVAGRTYGASNNYIGVSLLVFDTSAAISVSFSFASSPDGSGNIRALGCR